MALAFLKSTVRASFICLARQRPVSNSITLGPLNRQHIPSLAAVDTGLSTFSTFSSPYIRQRPTIIRMSSTSTPSDMTSRNNSTSSSSQQEDAGAQLRSQKQALRKEVRSRLRALSQEEITTQSKQVWDRVFGLPEFKAAKSVGIFLSMPSGEICTELALQACVDANKAIYVPQVGKNFESADMEMLKVIYDEKVKDDYKLFHHSWPRNKWGIPEPPTEMPIEAARPGDIDLLVVPGCAFDRNGNRLGQGKGYYDRFIERMIKHGQHCLPLVAAAMDCQMVEAVPVQGHDHTMHKIVLPSEVITISSPST